METIYRGYYGCRSISTADTAHGVHPGGHDRDWRAFFTRNTVDTSEQPDNPVYGPEPRGALGQLGDACVDRWPRE